MEWRQPRKAHQQQIGDPLGCLQRDPVPVPPPPTFISRNLGREGLLMSDAKCVMRASSKLKSLTVNLVYHEEHHFQHGAAPWV